MSHCVLQLREYCLRLRNMVASDATKAELSEALDTMIEEVSHTAFSCGMLYKRPLHHKQNHLRNWDTYAVFDWCN